MGEISGKTRQSVTTEAASGEATLPKKHVSRHGKVTALSMMKDEGPYVLEWVAHHLAVGFTDLVVYTNDCSDGTDDMLIRLEELGLAYHRRNDIAQGMKPQPSALKYAQDEPVVGDTDWLLTFDADEFLCIKYGDGTLDGLIDAIEVAGGNGMVVTWRIFGSGNVQHWSRDPVTEQYLHAAPPMWNKGWGVKTLFRFDPDIWKLGIHRPSMKNKVLDTDFPDSVKWLNGSGRPMEDYFKFRGWRSIVRTVGYDWAQMNHYAVKSIDSYAIRKFRGNVNNKKDKYNNDYWSLQDRNEVLDDSMLRYHDRRKAIFEGLLTDPVLNRLHFAALDRAEAKLAAFKGSADYETFVAGLQEAGRVPITQVSAKPPKARDPDKIKALMSDVEKRAGDKRVEEKQKPPEQRLLQPPGFYVRASVDMSSDPPMEWFTNHTMELPADPRIFTPPALILIEQGKFERNIARNLPKLVPEFGLVLEIGATSGFVAGHLSKVRPDLRLVVQEEDANFAGFLGKLWDQNGVAEGERVSRTADEVAGDPERLGGLIGEFRPAALLLGDPRITPATLAAAHEASGAEAPPLLLLMGRLWAERFAELKDFEAVFRRIGYRQRLPLDPLVCAAYSRTVRADGAGAGS